MLSHYAMAPLSMEHNLGNMKVPRNGKLFFLLCICALRDACWGGHASPTLTVASTSENRRRGLDSSHFLILSNRKQSL